MFMTNRSAAGIYVITKNIQRLADTEAATNGNSCSISAVKFT